MGRKLPFQILTALVSFLLVSCGDFAGFDSPGEFDTGDLEGFRINISAENEMILKNSMVSGRFADFSFEDGRNDSFSQNRGRIRIRGNSSRYRNKKSYTIELAEGDARVRYALDAGGDVWFEYGLAMAVYNKAGIPSPVFSPVALYQNNIYMGYYNIVRLYDTSLNDVLGNPDSQLFKADFEFPADNGDTHSESEKKFPDDNDYSLFDRLFVNAQNMDRDAWVRWIETPGVADFENIARYMVIRDFFGIKDVHRVNYYVYFGRNGFTILPWDSDGGFGYGPIGGNTLILKRMLESSDFLDLYKSLMMTYFLDSGVEESTDMLDFASSYVETQFELLQEAAGMEPYEDYDSFLKEYEYLNRFLSLRPDYILDHYFYWDFNMYGEDI